MKRFVLLLLALLCLIPTGCRENTPTESSSDGQASSTESPVTSEPYCEEDDDYLDIRPISTSGYQKQSFTIPDADTLFTFTFPRPWTLERQNDGSYRILRNRQEIGRLAIGEADDLSLWKSVAEPTVGGNGLTVTQYIEKSGTGDTLRFRRRFDVARQEDDAETCITITVNYEEISDSAAKILLNQSTLTEAGAPSHMGELKDLADGNLLILGNSFIGTSDIGEILNTMLRQNGKRANAQAVSRGMATVSTYARDANMLTAIRNGQYDAVFICGLYAASEISFLTTLKSACDKGNARLILFPAHNEDGNVIRAAVTQQKSLYLLDWKGELEALIANGVDQWDLCINDAYRHSSPLAGYVGAHMIYRAIYGEIPFKESSPFVDVTPLGNYATGGRVTGAARPLG